MGTVVRLPAGKPCCVFCGRAVTTGDKMPGLGSTPFRSIVVNGEARKVFTCDEHAKKFFKTPEAELAKLAQKPRKKRGKKAIQKSSTNAESNIIPLRIPRLRNLYRLNPPKPIPFSKPKKPKK